MKKGKVALVAILAITAAVATILIIVKNTTGKKDAVDEEYVPIEDFIPVYEQLTEAEVKAGGDGVYGLDATMRIIKGLELGRQKAADFKEYLDCMARQDYEMVALDVIEAQKEIMPVLQKMYVLSRDNEEMDGLWMLQQSAAGAVEDMESDAVACGILTSVPITAIGVGHTLSNVFDSYSKARDLKKKQAVELQETIDDYTVAIQKYWPVTLKYKEEWERLCSRKDQAYLDLYAGRNIESYNGACKILEDYPEDRDALLIKALSLIQGYGNNTGSQVEAEQILDNYIALYPGKTAPAYVLKGMLANAKGDGDGAFSYFDHAAIEYPRQAESLKDMLDAYINRPYFIRTGEGLYFQMMYKSTLEGYGYFSPNFQKALAYQSAGRLDKAAEEVYMHFFRRGNQVVQDYLLSDMEFCEKNLRESCGSAFGDLSGVDIKVNPKFRVFGKKKNRISITNNSGGTLENVRVFACYHLTDMFPGDYIVEKLETVNLITNGDKHTWDSDFVPNEEIVRTRAVLVTDSGINWIDGETTDEDEGVIENVKEVF